jgi:hypothetical protein
MAVTHGPFVETSVEPFRIRFVADGAAINLDSYGAITPYLRKGDGTAVATPGTVVKVTPQTGDNVGWATYTPSASAYTRSTGLLFNAAERFTFRCGVLDASLIEQFFPGGEWDTVIIRAR